MSSFWQFFDIQMSICPEGELLTIRTDWAGVSGSAALTPRGSVMQVVVAHAAILTRVFVTLALDVLGENTSLQGDHDDALDYIEKNMSNNSSMFVCLFLCGCVFI